jgi:hypothetical protein
VEARDHAALRQPSWPEPEPEPEPKPEIEPEPEPAAMLHNLSPTHVSAAPEPDVVTPKAGVELPTLAEDKLLSAVSALETKLEATQRSHELVSCTAERSHQALTSQHGSAGRTAAPVLAAQMSRTEEAQVELRARIHHPAWDAHIPRNQPVAGDQTILAASVEAKLRAEMSEQASAHKTAMEATVASHDVMTMTNLDGRHTSTLTEVREEHRREMQAARMSMAATQHQYVEEAQALLQVAHRDEVARLQMGLEAACAELAKVRSQHTCEREQLMAEAAARTEEIFKIKQEHSQALAIVVATKAESSETDSKVVHNAAVQTEDETKPQAEVEVEPEPEPEPMTVSLEAAIEVAVIHAVAAADTKHEAAVQAMQRAHAMELAMMQARAENQLATERAAVVEQMQAEHGAELAAVKQSAWRLGRSARVAHQLLRGNLAELASAHYGLRQDFISASSSLQQEIGAAIAVHCKCVQEEHSEQTEREQKLRAEMSSISNEMQKLQQRADGAAEALRGVLREERATNVKLRRELEGALLQVRSSATASSAPTCDVGNDVAVELLDDDLQLSTEKLLKQYHRGRKFRSMLDVFRQWVFLSDVRLASQQQKAEQDRASREDAQARELNALKRELRAVVMTSVANDIQRREAEPL